MKLLNTSICFSVLCSILSLKIAVRNQDGQTELLKKRIEDYDKARTEQYPFCNDEYLCYEVELVEHMEKDIQNNCKLIKGFYILHVVQEVPKVAHDLGILDDEHFLVCIGVNKELTNDDLSQDVIWFTLEANIIISTFDLLSQEEVQRVVYLISEGSDAEAKQVGDSNYFSVEKVPINDEFVQEITDCLPVKKGSKHYVFMHTIIVPDDDPYELTNGILEEIEGVTKIVCFAHSENREDVTVMPLLDDEKGFKFPSRKKRLHHR
jgi:hypothetical protein